MTTLTLWAPWRSSPTPASLIEPDRSEPKKRTSSQATLSQDQGEVLSNSVRSVQNVSKMSNLDMVEISSPQAWEEALQEVAQARICGLDLETTGLDPLSSRARLAQLSLFRAGLCG